MGDIVKIFSSIGEIYDKQKTKINNKSYEYDAIKIYLCDIKSKEISVNNNISRDDLIVCRFGIGANSGNLFPNVQFISKAVKDDTPKFIKGILKAVKNMLSCFNPDDIKNDKILTDLSSLNESFFDDILSEITTLQEEPKKKGMKVATFFALSWEDRPISAYFKNIFTCHLGDSNNGKTTKIYGYDMLTNSIGIGGDANLAFCSVNELPTALQDIKVRLLPLNGANVNLVKNGFMAIDKELSFNFYGDKMAVLPTLMVNDTNLLEKIVEILKDPSEKKKDLQGIQNIEESINYELESVAKAQANMPVLNTILFYKKSNAAVNVLLQIDDVLPSYISKISDLMGRYNIRAIRRKDSKDQQDDTIYMQNLFLKNIDIMNFLLSQNRMNLDDMMEKYAALIYKGNINSSYASKIEWGFYFNCVKTYQNRSIKSIEKYQNFFNEIGALNGKISFAREVNLQSLSDKKELISSILKNSEFLKDNEVLQSAYLLGMMSAGLINRQFAISKNSSFEKWLNNAGLITKELLERIWTKCDETNKKLSNVSRGKRSANIEIMRDILIGILPSAFLSQKRVKSAYVTLAFAMGGSDFTKYIKDNTQGDE
ncbi:TM1802 family CRISPR-associated protein [uncultured Campylobacter sp.]|uniref:TM1802 family CRISPR-associated protein n=1 Tax=uncultured Campylobacter sp. TaxID=218934 RepID=UPI00263A0866|nr:TM1802 family CRISPR-associated protein [uncultured Campylobacter sp.]